jgi:hypothetical protein
MDLTYFYYHSEPWRAAMTLPTQSVRVNKTYNVKSFQKAPEFKIVSGLILSTLSVDWTKDKV